MARTLPHLRLELDLMPSPLEERPGLLMRDPFQYSDATIIVPPLLAQALALFDGQSTDLDLRAWLTRKTGELQTAELAEHLLRTLEENGFLHSDTFFRLRDEKQAEFAAAPERTPAHAGSAYPDDADALRAAMLGWDMPTASSGAVPARKGGLIGLAAPHVSPEGGFKSYAAAYRRLEPEDVTKTFVILGTSHYGEPETFGLTRKAYQTPLGPVESDRAIVDELELSAPGSIRMEDYCHSSEHSIEFQTVYLQAALNQALPEGERLRAVPILCGSFFRSLESGDPPETQERLRRFFDALAELQVKRDDLIWVLGVDMAHIGRRYGDATPAQAEAGHMLEVRRKDEARLACIEDGDADGFFALVHPKRDELRWCGYSPIYTLLRSVSRLKGRTLSYEQWNIDPQSVVSFAGIEFQSND
jgi:AmmeMemoRadiSam system protein B